MNSIADIQHCLYINLAKRTDRRTHVEAELRKIGIHHFQRFDAICLPKKPGSGSIGCSISHLKCLELARKSGWPHVLIVEDDIEFTDPTTFIASFNAFLAAYGGTTADPPRFDVCLVGGNNMPPFIQRAPFCAKVSKCQTTTGYLVPAHYYDTLIENVRHGVQQLMRDPDVRVGTHYTECQLTYSIDKWWFQLQARDQWFLITPLTVTQRTDYSDIEERETNYSRVMLDIDKHNLFRQFRSVARAQPPPRSSGPQIHML